MSNPKLIEAHKLINERRYAEARRILREIRDDPQAQLLLRKLDVFAQPAANSSIPNPKIEAHRVRNKQNFEQWVKAEWTVCWIAAILLYGIAVYDLLVLIAFADGTFYLTMWLTIILAFVIASLSVWRASNKERLKRYVSNLKKRDQYSQRLLAIVCILLGLVTASLGLSRNKHPAIIVIETGIWILVSALWWWRADQIMRFESEFDR